MEQMNNEGVGWIQGGCVYLWNEYLMDERVDFIVERQ
jgi:hypothetical protein